MTVRGKLILFAATALGALAVIFAVGFVGGAYGEKTQRIGDAAAEARIALLEAQQAEKNFHEFHDDAYVEQLKERIAHLEDNAAIVAELEPEYAELAAEVGEKGKSYEKRFLSAVESTRIMGYTKDDGLQGRLSGAIGKLEFRIRQIGVNMGDILQALLMLRRSEKDFLINHS